MKNSQRCQLSSGSLCLLSQAAGAGSRNGQGCRRGRAPTCRYEDITMSLPPPRTPRCAHAAAVGQAAGSAGCVWAQRWTQQGGPHPPAPCFTRSRGARSLGVEHANAGSWSLQHVPHRATAEGDKVSLLKHQRDQRAGMEQGEIQKKILKAPRSVLLLYSSSPQAQYKRYKRV